MKSAAIIDDDPIVCNYLERTLTHQGIFETCCVLNSIAKTLSKLQQHSFDFYLLDLELPDGNACNLIPLIKEKNPHSKVLVMAKIPDTKWISQSIILGANGYIYKDEVHEGLINRIEILGLVDKALCGATLDRLLQGLALHEACSQSFESSFDLKARELQVLQMLKDGLPIKTIARNLDLSPHTVNQHLRAIYRKLGVHSRSEAVSKIIKGQHVGH